MRSNPLHRATDVARQRPEVAAAFGRLHLAFCALLLAACLLWGTSSGDRSVALPAVLAHAG